MFQYLLTRPVCVSPREIVAKALNISRFEAEVSEFELRQVGVRSVGVGSAGHRVGRPAAALVLPRLFASCGEEPRTALAGAVRSCKRAASRQVFERIAARLATSAKSSANSRSGSASVPPFCVTGSRSAYSRSGH